MRGGIAREIDETITVLELHIAPTHPRTDSYDLQRGKALPQLRFGVGIHGGEAVPGVIGTAGLSKFSVTGDPINVVSRIEGLTSKFQVDLLVSDDIRAALHDQFRLRAMPPTLVKGKAEPIQTWYLEPHAKPWSPIAP
ncbi:MAG: adenylate/guanylate cyclase domain-containing protein [Rhodoferax sp.]|nr:adenylate/guanylate cyclase domain-containing protein [Rhodoferax sp.]